MANEIRLPPGGRRVHIMISHPDDVHDPLAVLGWWVSKPLSVVDIDFSENLTPEMRNEIILRLQRNPYVFLHGVDPVTGEFESWEPSNQNFLAIVSCLIIVGIFLWNIRSIDWALVLQVIFFAGLLKAAARIRPQIANSVSVGLKNFASRLADLFSMGLGLAILTAFFRYLDSGRRR